MDDFPTEKPEHDARCDCGQLIEWIYDKDEGVWFKWWCWRCDAIKSMRTNLFLLGKHYDVDGNLRESGIQKFMNLITNADKMLEKCTIKSFEGRDPFINYVLKETPRKLVKTKFRFRPQGKIR
jgi:hypothetical protein